MTTESTSEKRNPFKLLTAALLLAVSILGVLYYQATRPDVDQTLLAISNNLNKTCPFNVDELTRLDNTTTFPGNIIQYNYTLFSIQKAEVNVAKAMETMEPIIISKVKKDRDMKVFLDLHTTLRYNYRDLNGEYIFTLSIPYEKYKVQ